MRAPFGLFDVIFQNSQPIIGHPLNSMVALLCDVTCAQLADMFSIDKIKLFGTFDVI